MKEQSELRVHRSMGGLLSYSNSGESALRPCYYGGSGEHVPVLRNIILLWWFLVWAVCTSSDICSDAPGGNEEPRREMRRQPSRTLQTLMNHQASRLESKTSSCQAAMIQGGLGEKSTLLKPHPTYRAAGRGGIEILLSTKGIGARRTRVQSGNQKGGLSLNVRRASIRGCGLALWRRAIDCP